MGRGCEVVRWRHTEALHLHSERGEGLTLGGKGGEHPPLEVSLFRGECNLDFVCPRLRSRRGNELTGRDPLPSRPVLTRVVRGELDE